MKGKEFPVPSFLAPNAERFTPNSFRAMRGLTDQQKRDRIIARLAMRDALKHLVLIGSWALCVYEESEGLPGTALVTQDIDFLVKQPRGPFPKATANICEILLLSTLVFPFWYPS